MAQISRVPLRLPRQFEALKPTFDILQRGQLQPIEDLTSENAAQIELNRLQIELNRWGQPPNKVGGETFLDCGVWYVGRVDQPGLPFLP